ncbi:MAG: hypothetical protein M3417_14995, partial [Actinomycetota bacterium]|nr:hypothetical protein [Actinomycetota bacterium]
AFGGDATAPADDDRAPASTHHAPLPACDEPLGADGGRAPGRAYGDEVHNPPPVQAVAPPGIDLAALKELWPAVLDSLREQHALLHGVIAPAVPRSLEGHDLVLAYDPSQAFFRRKAESAAHRAALAEVIRTLVGFQPRLIFELVASGSSDTGPAPPPAVTEAEWIERFKQEFDAHEIVPDPEESKP